MTKNFKKYGYYLILIAIFILGFFMRLKGLIANPSFWHDECALGWNVIHKNYGELFEVLNFTQIAPPFFMVMSKFFTQIFGVSDFVLRITPFIFGILSLLIFPIFADRIFKNKLTIIISFFIFAINQTLINYSSEFKHYSSDVFFTLLCLFLINEIIRGASFKKSLFYCVIFATSIWFSFVSSIAIGAGFFVIFFQKIIGKKFDLKKSFLTILPIVISTVVYLKFYLLNTYLGNQQGMNEYWDQGFISKNLLNFLPLLELNLKYFLFPLKFVYLAFFLFFSGIIVLFKKNFYNGLTLFLTVALTCFVSWLGYYPFQKRVILFLLPVFIIFTCAPLELINIKRRFLSMIILILFIFSFSANIKICFEFITKISHPTRGYYSRQMMKEMLSKIKPGDIILINQNSNTEFAYYASFHEIKNQVIQEPQQGNPHELIKSLKKNVYYWFYMPYGTSPTVEKWINENPQILLYEWGYNNRFERLRYIKIK